jgi:molybdate transport repressor ModE-like protein
MLDLSIGSNWVWGRKADDLTLTHLVQLLVAMHQAPSLAEATRQANVSYRNSWALLKRGEALFGAPLAVMQRGMGATLTPLGEKLVWAQHRVEARLSPILDNLASEIGSEIEEVLNHQSGALRLHASHGFAVETLSQRLARDGAPLELRYRGALAAVASFARNGCDIAGFHVPIGEFEGPVLEHYAPWLRSTQHRVIHLATRKQGLIVRQDQARFITSLHDLVRPGMRFVNRPQGSGTRILFDKLIARERISGRDILGYDTAEDTHAAVAAVVASGMADVGFGLERPARRFGLDFIPLVTENYLLLINLKSLTEPRMQPLLSVITSSEFRLVVNALPGYDASNSGHVLSLADAFPSWPKLARLREAPRKPATSRPRPSSALP